MTFADMWWKKTTIYQIYPRSFRDSNADGIGDIPGIIEKLDYIRDLGFETIWISPFFTSPQQDWGYDIADYLEIAPEYGSLADVKRLVDEVHRRKMKVLFDLVLNHTSIQHPWFIESSSSRENPRSDWYIWRDGKGNHRPPNNWKAIPGGSGWHYHSGRQQWYFASFLPFQPDLNFRNPEVKDEMFRTAKYWLDFGVDGFRLDIFHAIYKAEHFKNNPPHWSYLPRDDKFGFFTQWKYTVNQPETIQLAHELRAMTDSFSPAVFMLGEIFCDDRTIREYLGGSADGMHAIFLWDLMDFKFKAKFFWDVLNKYETWYPPPYTPVLVLGNHDSRRWIDRAGSQIQKAKLIVLLQLTARGIPVAYYGDEIGLPEGTIPAKQSLDPIGQRYAWAPNWLLNLLHFYVNRDNCRTPMVWENAIEGGFTDGSADPWLPLSADPATANTADQLISPGSLLHWYGELLEFRKASPALHSGRLDLLPRRLAKKGLLGYIRQNGPDRIAVLLNFTEDSLETDLGPAHLLIGTGKILISTNKLILGRLAGGIFRIPDQDAA